MSDFDIISDFDKMVKALCENYCVFDNPAAGCLAEECPARKYRAELVRHMDREEDDLA